MMATVRHVTAWAGRTKYKADGFLLGEVYMQNLDISLTQQVLYWKYDRFTIKIAVLGPIFVQFINTSGRTNINKQELFMNLFSLKAQWRHIQSSEIYIAP